MSIEIQLQIEDNSIITHFLKEPHDIKSKMKYALMQLQIKPQYYHKLL